VEVTKPNTKETNHVTQEHFIIELFCRVDDMLPNEPKHFQAKLSSSELITLGLLFALKGVSQHAFYRWLKQNWSELFPNLPERTRFFRRLKTHRRLTEKFLAEPTVFGVIDSYGIELCHPIRENHQPRRARIGKKGFASWKWIVGGKFCLLANKFGLVTDWSVKTANVSDQEFLPLVERVTEQMIVLADIGFRRKVNQPENLKICRRGEWNDRMLIETIFSLLSQVCKLKHLRQRVWAYFEMRLGLTVALFNLLQQWKGLSFDENGVSHLSLAEFSL
jgi:hypothetical protein